MNTTNVGVMSVVSLQMNIYLEIKRRISNNKTIDILNEHFFSERT
jgi:hypothetical protein